MQNNTETITFTVYNEQGNPITGVLLTDTLTTGVTFVAASQLPDQNGPNLAWSLGTIQGFDRASVTATVSLANSNILQLDMGAQAFATLNAGPISNATPVAMLTPGNVDASLLASTPDANTSDPYIQEEAAKLNYNPQAIYSFLQTQIGYNSYTGSLRGARGTLWSSAGNALDVASLGVALMRASGIPAQYAEGTLSQGQAQQLILSMFPASYQTVGYIPAGTQLADPANDSQLLAETEDHFWFQFDAGNGMMDADPLFVANPVGTAVTSQTNSFTEVPDNLRQKTEISLTAEIYSQALASLGGLAGSPFTETVVLDQTFNDVDLVGRPLTIGNFVNSVTLGSVIAATTNTYSPYLMLGDEANPDPNADELIRGQSYQDVLTSFPLGSQIVTGLFLNVTLTGPQGPAQSYEKTLVDLLGPAVRTNGGSPQISVSASGPTTINPLEVWSVSVLPGLQDAGAALSVENSSQNNYTQLGNDVASGQTSSENDALTSFLIGQTRGYLVSLLATSDQYTDSLASNALLAAYFDSPRITVISAPSLCRQRATGGADF